MLPRRTTLRCVATITWVASLSAADFANAAGPLEKCVEPLTSDARSEQYDPPPAGVVRSGRPGGMSGLDTVRFGGRDASGLAIEGGVWDFEDGTLQGWWSEDLTVVVQADPPGDPSVGSPGNTYFRRVTAADFSGATTIPVMNGVGSLWAGANDEEAAAGCWPGGLGYDNGWIVDARKTFVYGGSGAVTIQFDYFTDSETQFDYTYVYVETDGVRSTPLNTSAWATDEGWGYSGATLEGSAIGAPSTPAHDTIVIDPSFLPDASGEAFWVVFEFDSDVLYSDGLDSFFGYLNSLWGPFGMDDFRIEGVGLSDTDTFEVDEEGWTFESADPIGSFLQAVELVSLDPIDDGCRCPITLDPENDHVIIAADHDGSIAGGYPHPKRQHEWLRSNPVVIIDGSNDDGEQVHVVWNVWEDMPTSNGVGYRVAVDYYPWTCPETDIVSWTLEPVGDPGFIWSGLGGPRCSTLRVNNTEFMAEAIAGGIDSLRIVFELLGDCDDFGTTSCTGPERTNASPYWDDVRLELVTDVDAPWLATELLFNDVFPDLNSLLPSATASVKSFYDNNRADLDRTNADMGDSAVVICETGADVYLNYRLYLGPAMSASDVGAFLLESRAGPHGVAGAAGSIGDAVGDQGNGEDGRGRFASCRLVELDPDSRPGEFATYSAASGSKILPDDVLTPGATVEYFFSVFGPTGEVRTHPDTSNGDDDSSTFFFLELEVLPGMLDAGGGDIVSSRVLYVDAYNAGAQQPIENEGLRPTLGVEIDVDGIAHDRWDRYDYLVASSTVPAPLAREAAGDNGMTKYQSLVYRTILYNTGTFAQEGLRDGDAELLLYWLTTVRPDGSEFRRGLWLSGNGIASILSRTGRADNNALLSQYVQASLVGTSYRYEAGDPSLCVRLDADPGSDVSAPGSYASVRENGCPLEYDFDVLGVTGDGAGDLVYVDQDAGEGATPFASVSSDQSPTSTGRRVVLDAFSLHYLRATPDGWLGDGEYASHPGDGVPCADYAILERVADVFDFLEAPTAATALAPVAPLIIGIDDGVAHGPPAPRTALYASSPNPFSPTTSVRYRIGRELDVRLRVHDVAGRLVRTLVHEVQVPGTYQVQWDGTAESGENASGGVYWARLTTSDGFSASTKLVVLR